MARSPAANRRKKSNLHLWKCPAGVLIPAVAPQPALRPASRSASRSASRRMAIQTLLRTDSSPESQLPSPALPSTRASSRRGGVPPGARQQASSSATGRNLRHQPSRTQRTGRSRTAGNTRPRTPDPAGSPHVPTTSSANRSAPLDRGIVQVVDRLETLNDNFTEGMDHFASQLSGMRRQLGRVENRLDDLEYGMDRMRRVMSRTGLNVSSPRSASRAD